MPRRKESLRVLEQLEGKCFLPHCRLFRPSTCQVQEPYGSFRYLLSCFRMLPSAHWVDKPCVSIETRMMYSCLCHVTHNSKWCQPLARLFLVFQLLSQSSSIFPFYPAVFPFTSLLMGLTCLTSLSSSSAFWWSHSGIPRHIRAADGRDARL